MKEFSNTAAGSCLAFLSHITRKPERPPPARPEYIQKLIQQGLITFRSTPAPVMSRNGRGWFISRPDVQAAAKLIFEAGYRLNHGEGARICRRLGVPYNTTMNAVAAMRRKAKALHHGRYITTMSKINQEHAA